MSFQGEPIESGIGGIDSDQLQRLDVFLNRKLKALAHKKMDTLVPPDVDSQPQRVSDLAHFDLGAAINVMQDEGYEIDVDRIFIDFPAYLDIFFDEELIKLVDPDGVYELIEMALQCAANPSFASSIQLRTGVGVHDLKEHSVRLPSYIHPMVSMVNKFTEHYRRAGFEFDDSHLPRAVIYSAGSMVTRVNGLDEASSQSNIQFNHHVFRRYVEDCLKDPTAVSAFKLLVDRPVVEVGMHERLMDIARTIVQTRGDLKVVQKVMNTARLHDSDELMGVYYAVSHAIYSLDPVDGLEGQSLIVDEDELPRRVIMIGGKSETDYWGMRQLVRSPRSEGFLDGHVQMIQRRSEIPPYGGALIDNDLTTLDLPDIRNSDDMHEVMKAKALRTTFKKDIELVCNGHNDQVGYLKHLFNIR